MASKVPKCGAQEGGEDSTSHFHNAQKKKTIEKTRNDPLNNSDTFSQNVGPTAEPVRVANPEGQQSQAPSKAKKKKYEKKEKKKDAKKYEKKAEKKDEKIDLLGEPRLCHTYLSLLDENRARDRFESIFTGEQIYGGGGGLPVQQTRRARENVHSFRNVSQEFPAWENIYGERLQHSGSSTNDKSIDSRFIAGMISGALLSLCIVWIGFKVLYVLAFLGIV